MIDLLREDFKQEKGFTTISACQNSVSDYDIETGTAAGSNAIPNGSLLDFFQKVDEIKERMLKIQNLLRNLQEENEVSKTLTKTAAMKASKEKMELCVDEVIKQTKIIKGKLEKLDEENLANRKIPGCEEDSGVDRSRISVTLVLKKKLHCLMTDFQNLKQKLRDEYRSVVERRIFTVSGQEPDAELVENLIETGESERIFQKAIQDQGQGHILSTLAEIEERHEAVKDLEQKLLELHQIFLDMAVLVESQGEILDNIEEQVAKAAEYTEAGTAVLAKAKKLQKNKRKWVTFAILLLLLIIVIIVVPVMQPWKDKKA